MQISLVEVIAMLGVISGVVGVLYRELLMRFRAQLEEKDRAYEDMQQACQQRHLDDLEDRNFWRGEFRELQKTNVEVIFGMRDGVKAIQEAVAFLVRQREDREGRGAT